MPLVRHHLAEELTAGFERIRAKLDVAESFPDDVDALATLRASVGGCGSEPPGDDPERIDRTDVELFSLDPEGSRDLDQALHLERNGSGYRFHYAIADVAAWVRAGDAIDLEARRRTTTVYCPDRRIPLHPPVLSEGAASLLADGARPALLWTIDLDQRGTTADATVEHAVVRNRAARSYRDAQAAIDAGHDDDQLRLLEEVGMLRSEIEVSRGGVSLNLPEQTVRRVGDGYELRYDDAMAVEGWNAQLSLCCGMAAAELMLHNGVGILRTLPPAGSDTIEQLRRHSDALGVAWPTTMDYPTWVRSLDTSTPQGAALVQLATTTLRGAGYLAFDGTIGVEHRHAAIAADYSHVTAPLRRLVDRFAGECCVAAAERRRPADWALAALDSLPGEMEAGGRRAQQVERAVIDLAEAAVLSGRVGEYFDAVVTANAKGRPSSTVQIEDPAVVATLDEVAPIGSTVKVRLAQADIATSTVRFEAAR
ncbi:MAG: RNB domain-containing ribonuclease [Microthrixaceae bacterium]